MKYFNSKLFMIFLAGFFILFLTSDFSIIDIEKTAIIVALGVDKTEDGLYEVSAQIAVPEATDNTPSNAESVINGVGETVYEAVDQIGVKTGWYPKLSFCNLVILSKDLLSENVLTVTDYFLRSLKIEDTAIMCVAEKSAKELLTASSPLDNISSFALLKIFVKEHDKASPVLTTTVKEFCLSSYSHSHFGYIPLVKAVPTGDKEDESSSADSGLSGSSGNGGGASSSNSGAKEPVVFDASETLLFSSGIYSGKLEGDETLYYSLMTKGVNETYITVTGTDGDGKSGRYLIDIASTRRKVKLEFKDSPLFTVELNMSLRLEDTDVNQSIKELSKVNLMTENLKSNATATVEDGAKKVFEKIKESGVDILEVLNASYRKHNKEFKKLGETILTDVEYNIKVTCDDSN